MTYKLGVRSQNVRHLSPQSHQVHVTPKPARPSAPGTHHHRESPFPPAAPHHRFPTHLLNSGSFSRSNRAEWQVTRVRSNCVINSGKVLPIWFSASRHAQPQPPGLSFQSKAGWVSTFWAPHCIPTEGIELLALF